VNWGSAVSATHAENLIDAIQGVPMSLQGHFIFKRSLINSRQCG
jgi:hypothetical protein